MPAPLIPLWQFPKLRDCTFRQKRDTLPAGAGDKITVACGIKLDGVPYWGYASFTRAPGTSPVIYELAVTDARRDAYTALIEQLDAANEAHQKERTT